MKFGAPRAPTHLDGRLLPETLQARFARLIAVIYDLDPLRQRQAILHLAETALRATATLTPNGWASLRTYSLGGGDGPSLRLR